VREQPVVAVDEIPEAIHNDGREFNTGRERVEH
jgi:hypothetical protein